MFRFFPQLRSWWRGVRHHEIIDAEMENEFRLHMELRAADLQRAGLSAAEAMRRARVEFGGTYNYTEQGREARGLAAFDSLRLSWLDFRLGARMIAKYPGLTVMSALAIGVAIAIGAGVSGAIATIRDPKLPFPQGDRIVGIQLWDISTRGVEQRVAREFTEWRGSLRSIVGLSAFRPTVLNLIDTEGRGEPIRGVEMTATGFRVTRVPPLLGRYLLDDDERPDAPPVVVLGYDTWRSRFNGDTGIVGRSLRIGGESRVVVGVMPEGFKFPVNYAMWVPLRLDSIDVERRSGPQLLVFGRLADGTTLDDARAELGALVSAAARAHPRTSRDLRARVLPYTQSWFRLDDPDIALALDSVILVVTLLVVVICVNVATLVYARTATRQSEIAVRCALGATRARIVAQLFGEACVLSGCGAVVGLVLIAVMGTQLESALTQFGVRDLPFWIHLDVGRWTLLDLVGLAFLGATIIGVLPALRLTGPRVHLALQRLSGGHSTIRMGKLWTALIVIEVAFAVALLPIAARFTGEWLEAVSSGPGFDADHYLSANLVMEARVSSSGAALPDPTAFRIRFARSRDGLFARLASDPRVVSTTYASSLPGSEQAQRIETDMSLGPDTIVRHWNAPRVRFGRVAPGYFSTLDIPVASGRALDTGDADSAGSAIVVNRAFVDSVFHGLNPIGHRVRTIRFERNIKAPSAWLEIVGVVGDFPPGLSLDVPRPAMYQAADIGRLYPIGLIVRTRNDATLFADQLRGIGASVQPEFLFRDVGLLADRMHAQEMPLQWLAVSLAVVTLCVLVLSCAGVYALMSVAVTQRRREIGIRVALGAQRGQMLWSVFSRAALQVGTGALAGIGVSVLLNSGLAEGELFGQHNFVILSSVAVFVAAVGILASLVPARTALAISPAEALKSE